jgi:hypothetical protein
MDTAHVSRTIARLPQQVAPVFGMYDKARNVLFKWTRFKIAAVTYNGSSVSFRTVSTATGGSLGYK